MFSGCLLKNPNVLCSSSLANLQNTTPRLRIWQNGSSTCQKMASSESSSEEPSEYSANECYGPLTLRNPVSSESSSEESSEYSAQERNRPSTRQQVAPSESSSEEPSEHSPEEQTCSDEEQEAVILEWKSAEYFQELLDLNRKFLRGESKRSCYHRGHIFNETIALVPGLLRLHDYGMLTMESQPGTAPTPTTVTCPCCSDERWIEIQQRPYLMFTLPYHDKVPEDVVRRFLAEKKEDLASAELKHQQRLDLQCGCETDIFATYDDVMEDASPLLVRVLAKSWDETDLQALVENAAIRAGAQPLYADAADE
ncbi:hypothetical protein D0867_11644 [Hortaea werneckii]|uniref:DUF6919 domain-containing protein n=2 Tax=Hortaea werneckii TaxID=91943 RepID=A0A3M6YCR1_HORWE|nr:hypothetical protein D0867_11644 [Hortaea werneckii]